MFLHKILTLFKYRNQLSSYISTETFFFINEHDVRGSILFLNKKIFEPPAFCSLIKKVSDDEYLL